MEGVVREPDRARLRKAVEQHMARQGLRSTGQRRLIIEKFFEAPEHVTIDQLLRVVRGVDPRIGYATVYRTMKMLAQGGIAHERRFGDGFTRYELADDDAHHDHLICLECDTIIEFEEPAIEEIQAQLAARHGFEVRHHKHELYGTCARCRAERAAGKRSRR